MKYNLGKLVFGLVLFGMSVLGLALTASVFLMVAMVMSENASGDEPIILRQSGNQTIGIAGDTVISLHSGRDQTFGIAGDDIIIIHHPDGRFNVRMEVINELQTESGSLLETHSWESSEELQDLQPEDQ